MIFDEMPQKIMQADDSRHFANMDAVMLSRKMVAERESKQKD